MNLRLPCWIGLAVIAGPAWAARYGMLPDGRVVKSYTLSNDRGMTVEIVDYGAAIVRMMVPDAAGKTVNAVLAPGDLAGFLASKRRYGAIVGRYAGRLRGSVVVEGRAYPLATNEAGVTLHGGDPGFDRALWTGRKFADRGVTGVELKYRSRDGEQGFPGTLDVTARYALARNRNVLTLDIIAAADRTTVANLTNHSYFNLAGAGDVGCHSLSVAAKRRVETDGRRLPTGALTGIAGGPLDFSSARVLGPVLHSTNPLVVDGLDHMLVLSRRGSARLRDAASGRTMTLRTSEPGLQVYTANALDGSDRDGQGLPLLSHGGIALEPQHFPDSPWIAAFPSTRVSPGHPLRWHAEWAFGTTRPGACAAT